MSDLISRSALLKQLLEVKDDEIIKGVIGLVQTQPTAYDIEKVVAELEEEGKSYARYSVNTEGVKSIPTYKAIDIVRKGGVE